LALRSLNRKIGSFLLVVKRNERKNNKKNNGTNGRGMPRPYNAIIESPNV